MKKLLLAFLLLSSFGLAQTTCVNCGGSAAYASGGTTNNVIPKSNGSSLLADSAMTDSGTRITSTEPFIVTVGGSTANAAISFAALTEGIMYASSATWGLQVDATNWLQLSNSSSVGPLAVNASGYLSWSSSDTFNAAVGDTFLSRVAAGIPQVGLKASASPAARTFQIGESSRGGTDSNVAGSAGTIRPGIGTGNGAGAKFAIQRNLMGASGSTAQSTTDGFVVGESKTLSNASATATSLVNISVPSNSSAGVQGVINVSCNDGTNFDSETNTFFVSVVNKAGAMTVGTAQLGTPSTANNFGSCTTAITAVAGTNSVDIKVTPVIGTIVPTTVTGTVLSLSSYATGNVTVN